MPDDPDLAIETGSELCLQLLEPLQSRFGRIAIRSAYRSREVNAFGNARGFNCASNEANYAGHIWDMPNADGKGAMACIVVPAFATRFATEGDWRKLAWWIHDHLPYSTLEFFPKLWAFNLGWHEMPRHTIYSHSWQPGLADQAGDE